MIKTSDMEKQKEIEKNIMFVSTIYDSFEALEETLGKLKLEQPLLMTHAAKKAFAAEVIKYAEKNPPIYATPKKEKSAEQPTVH